MIAVVRSLAAAAVAALLVVAFEVGRTLISGATELGSAAQILGFVVAVLGLLGAPLWVAGALVQALLGATARGWRWGLAERPPLPGAARAGWVVYTLLALAGLVLATQGATVQLVKILKRPIYQGLGAGLTSAAVVLVAAALAGPLVGALTRAFSAASRRLPPALDPTVGRGAALWVIVVVGGLAVVAPSLRKELHTVDLRPARLALVWVALLWGARWLVVRWPSGPHRARWLWGGVATTAAASAAALGWSAAALGDSQSRVLAVERDTLLTGAITRRLSRFGDADGDGVPRLFAGGDCDDTDPAIRPGVYDPPGDGVDQNCTGADLDLAADPLRRPRHRSPTGEPRPWHVVLITVDALRSDTFRTHMPQLNALAAESMDYRAAYAHGAATYWSIPALLGSTMPSRLRMGRDQTPINEELLLTEVLRDAGWHTALFANVTVFFVRGLRQGAQVTNYETSHFTVHGDKPGSAHLTDGLLRHVDAFQAKALRPARDRMFLWAHYYDPHDPYFVVPGFPAADSSDRARYEAICRYVDAEIARLIEGLKARGVWDRTLFVLTADHGDEFLDHGHRFHGATLYDEMTRVPLLIKVPELPGRSLETPIGHLEVAPTLLELLNVPIPRQFLGRSRAEEIRTGAPAEAEPVYLEVFPDSNYAGHQVAVRLGPLKLIWRVVDNIFELYDLDADPRERRNVYDLHPHADPLRALLGVYLDHHLYHLALGRSGAKLPLGVPPGGVPPQPTRPGVRPGKAPASK